MSLLLGVSIIVKGQEQRWKICDSPPAFHWSLGNVVALENKGNAYQSSEVTVVSKIVGTSN